MSKKSAVRNVGGGEGTYNLYPYTVVTVGQPHKMSTGQFKAYPRRKCGQKDALAPLCLA